MRKKNFLLILTVTFCYHQNCYFFLVRKFFICEKKIPNGRNMDIAQSLMYHAKVVEHHYYNTIKSYTCTSIFGLSNPLCH